MATTSKTLFRGAATTNTATVLYTCTSPVTTTVITNVVVTNTAGSSGTFTLAFAGTNFATTVTVAALDAVVIDLKQPLVPSQTITGGASATTINFHIAGVEIS
jgi:hypothetical protein